jgi:tetratricopeptide (TPR) repeat protein
MEKLRFIFSETARIVCLAFLGLVAAKAIGSLQARNAQPDLAHRVAWVRGVLYASILALVVMGARGLGVETSAGIHALASESNIRELQLDKAYSNAARAVELRPTVYAYWRDLSVAKFVVGQFSSVLKDEPVYRALSNGDLEEDMTLRLAYCHYFLGEYEQVFPLTGPLIRNNHYLASPLVLEGMTYMAEKKYAQAERKFLEVLQVFPNQQAAVEGLAHVHYLMGDPGNALEVLNDTAKFSFTPEARKRFDALKAFYGQ